MHEHDGHRALADRGGDPLGRLGPRRRRRRTRRARWSPGGTAPGPASSPAARSPSTDQVGAGEHEAAGVAHAPTPSSQSVRGAAPMNTNSQAGRRPSRCSPVALSRRVSRSRWSSPCAATTSVQGAHRDVVDALDLLDQVVRHRRGQRRRRAPAWSPTGRTGRSTPRPGRPSWRRRRCRRPGRRSPAASVSAEP